MWIAYFAVAISVLSLAILLFFFARRRASATPDAASSSEYVTIASMFVSVAALLVALAALYVAFQALGQSRGPAAAIQSRPAAPETAKRMPPAVAPAEPSAQATAAKAGAAGAPPPAPATSPAPKLAATAAPPKASASPAGPAPPAKEAPPPASAGKPAEASKPDVRLEFEMSRTAVGITLVNDSASDPAARVSCLARLWDLDDPDNDSFSHPITIHCGTASLGPRTARGPVRLVKGPSNEPRVIEKGDRFIGYVAVSCPDCAEARSYGVYFVLGAKLGWYAAEDRSDAATVEFTRGTAVAAAKQLLARSDKLRIRAAGGL